MEIPINRADRKQKILEKAQPAKKFFDKAPNEPCFVALSIGSRAVSVLMSRVTTIEGIYDWDTQDLRPVFHSDNWKSDLAYKIQSESQPINCGGQAFLETLLFIKTIREALSDVPNSHFVLVGTEALRKASNSDEIISTILETTGLLLDIIQPEVEAYYCMLALKHTFWRTKEKGVNKLTDNDYFLLCDQGGGSCELSFLHGQKQSDIKSLALKQFDLPLLSKFFSQEKYGTIPDAVERINRYVDSSYQSLEIFPHDINESDKLNLFGTGTVIKECFEKKYLYKKSVALNGLSMTLAELEKFYNATIERLSDKFETVNKLNDAARIHERFENDPLLLFALPVYIGLLKKMSSNTINYSYFNLRYGLYFDKYVDGSTKAPSPYIN